MTATLPDQIMDELMERRMTLRQLAGALGATYIAVYKAAVILQGKGLIYPTSESGPDCGRTELVFDMVRTRKVVTT